ncbi:hypothetical protein FPOAC1_004243 [Fusarium poae]|uniref:hypothetical protein n=1 Tax=Fusarium poae TaxID=36050 RepID=UPI001CE7FA15|nr:hypothetical protein FPOAC1_004243 [Fusarium poae]KAG8671006.1 hypothetical protein FPOAC1_004243 [Fusarium poae]
MTTQVHIWLDGLALELFNAFENLESALRKYKKAFIVIMAQYEDMTSFNTNLDAVNTSLVETIVLLQESGTFLEDVLSQIEYLKRSFSAVATLLRASVKEMVNKSRHTARTSTSPDQTFEMESFSLLDIEQSVLYQDTLALQACYEIFTDLISGWDYLILYHISPAICTLTQIGIYTNARDRTSQNIRTLGEWWQDAVPKVSIVVAFGKNMKILKLDLEDIVSGTIPETYQMAKPKDQKATKKAVVKILKRISRHTSQRLGRPYQLRAR